MLTEPQIEQAARKLCELRGIDPGKVFSRQTAVVEDFRFETRIVLTWEYCALEIRAYLQVVEAIALMHRDEWRKSQAEPPPFCPPPGPCECGHPYFKHYAVTGMSPLRCHDCECAGYFEFSAPQDRG